MISLREPLRFEPYLRPMVWGGRKLGSMLGKTLPDGAAYGESWDVSDHASHRSRLEQGPASLVGTDLRRLMETNASDLLGTAASRHNTFPWLVKFLDAADWLSIQVHPSDANAARLWPGEGGKTEAWFILGAEPKARVWAGLKPGVGPKEFGAALEKGGVLDCLHSFAPRPGQCVFLPAGTVHAVGGGVLMAEVQQTSDATFRLYDWDRKDAQGKSRTLHIEQGLEATDFTRGPVQPVQVEGMPSMQERSPHLKEHRRKLVECPFFTLEYRQGEGAEVGGVGKLQCVIVLAGGGRFEGGSDFVSGQVWILPAAAAPAQMTGNAALLVATLP